MSALEVEAGHGFAQDAIKKGAATGAEPAGSRARRRSHIAQNRLKPGADSGHITADARLVAYDGISIESEELILRIGSSKNVD